TVFAQGIANMRYAVRPQKVYDSPQAVFEAYRQAFSKNDLRVQLSCMTPRVREDFAFQVFRICSYSVTIEPKLVAVLQKFGAEPSAVDAEFHDRYKRKRGNDLRKMQAEYQEKETRAVAEYFRRHNITNGAIPVPNSITQQI